MMNDMLPSRHGASRGGPGFLPRFSSSAQQSFQTPQAVAAEDDQNAGQAASPKTPAGKTPGKKRSFKEWLQQLSTKQKVWLSIAAVAIVAGIGVGTYLALKPTAPPPVTKKPPVKKEMVPVPSTVPSTLTGLEVDPSVNERPVIAVMIENSLDARPQSGLNQAGVVFEAIAEGGITRFTALFQDTEPDYVGPVRSVRPYYLQWIMGFDAAIAHAGGSDEALSDIQKWHTKDLNHSSAYFWRVNNRAAPHNLYTSIAKLREYAAQKGYGKSNYTGFARKKEQPTQTPQAKTIDFNISSANFKVHYDYDTATNSYLRSEGGAAHKDEKSGSQITPKVIVALIMPQGKNGVYTTYNTIGSGSVYVFQDGSVTQGTWQKSDNSKQFSFTDQNGKTLTLNAGQTWVTVLGSTGNISYAP